MEYFVLAFGIIGAIFSWLNGVEGVSMMYKGNYDEGKKIFRKGFKYFVLTLLISSLLLMIIGVAKHW